MGDSLCDMFLKEHEKYLPIHAMIQASTIKPKTPYQLDLEVKDRKPSIIPKVGDKVKIKSKEWYYKWKDPAGNVLLDLSFDEEMAKYCGRVVTVSRVDYDDTFKIKEDGCLYWFSYQAIEEVYPVSPSIHPSGSELVLSKEAIEKLTKQMSFYQCKCDTSLLECTVPSSCSWSDTQSKRPEQTKLQLVKSRPLLKLKKL